jgi:hypothetical protein
MDKGKPKTLIRIMHLLKSQQWFYSLRFSNRKVSSSSSFCLHLLNNGSILFFLYVLNINVLIVSASQSLKSQSLPCSFVFRFSFCHILIYIFFLKSKIAQFNLLVFKMVSSPIFTNFVGFPPGRLLTRSNSYTKKLYPLVLGSTDLTHQSSLLFKHSLSILCWFFFGS